MASEQGKTPSTPMRLALAEMDGLADILWFHHAGESVCCYDASSLACRAGLSLRGPPRRDAEVSHRCEGSESIYRIMNDRQHSPHGKINLHGDGLGVPSPETVEERAREIAMIDERNPDEFTEEDWRQAKNELIGVEGSHAPEIDDEVDDELSERDDIPGASGHQARNDFEDDENVGEELVSGGIEEAAHDQMVEARREELDQEREQP